MLQPKKIIKAVVEFGGILKTHNIILKYIVKNICPYILLTIVVVKNRNAIHLLNVCLDQLVNYEIILTEQKRTTVTTSE